MRGHQERRDHAGEDAPERFAEEMPAPAQCGRELLRQVHPHRRKCGENGEPGDQRPHLEHDRRGGAQRCAVIIIIRPGIASTNEPVIVQRRPTISIM